MNDMISWTMLIIEFRDISFKSMIPINFRVCACVSSSFRCFYLRASFIFKILFLNFLFAGILLPSNTPTIHPQRHICFYCALSSLGYKRKLRNHCHKSLILVDMCAYAVLCFHWWKKIFFFFLKRYFMGEYLKFLLKYW